MKINGNFETLGIKLFSVVFKELETLETRALETLELETHNL